MHLINELIRFLPSFPGSRKKQVGGRGNEEMDHKGRDRKGENYQIRSGVYCTVVPSILLLLMCVARVSQIIFSQVSEKGVGFFSFF